MKVESVMTKDPRTCCRTDTLNVAAKIFWEQDCGCVPVVDPEGRAIGVLTDRDVCIAAYTQGRPLSEISVETAMSRELFACAPGDTLEQVQETLRDRRIRRLPVVDDDGRLVGIVSLNDIAREASRQREGRKRDVSERELGRTLAALCESTGRELTAVA